MKTLGFIGLGLMGEAMCANVIKKSGKPVIVYDIDPLKVKLLVSIGGTGATSIREVAEKADVIISMVPKSEHVTQVVTEILEVMKPGTILIDMSTIAPKVSASLARCVREKGGWMLDAPVVKSRPAAIKGEIGIYVGGDEETFKKVKFILECMGSNIIYLGANGSGLMMKLVHNFMVGGIQCGINEALILSEKAGLKIEDVAKAMSYGGGQSFYLDAKHDSLKREDYSPVFPFEHMHKDINLTVEMAEECGVSLAGLEKIRQIYEIGMERGMGREDFSATIKVAREMAKPGDKPQSISRK